MVAASIALVGCASVIHVTQPPAGVDTDPVPQIKVSFGADFKPTEPWFVSLDGVNVTGFVPTPAPGGTSTANIVFGPGGSGSVPAHTISTNATCGTFCVYPADPDVVFTPPALLYNGTLSPKTLDVPLHGFASAEVDVQYSRSVPITVRVHETSTPPRVKLGLSASSMLAPGSTLFVTIPASDTNGPFVLQGESLGGYVLEFTAAGTTPGHGVGTVK
jgi:hypothetical protein